MMKFMQALFFRHRTTFVALSGGCRGLQCRKQRSGQAIRATSPEPSQLRPKDLKKSSLRGVPLSVGWLVVRKEPVHLKVAHQLLSNNPFDDLGDECQVRNWTITLDIVWIKIMFFEDWCDDSSLLWFREQTMLKGNIAHDADEREQLI